MFGFFGSFGGGKNQRGQTGNKNPLLCEVFYREPLGGGPGVYVEVREDSDHLVYVSNRGVTPAYLNTPYDQWCRENLIESYVFATLESALDYFHHRPGGVKPDLVSAIRGQRAA